MNEEKMKELMKKIPEMDYLMASTIIYSPAHITRITPRRTLIKTAAGGGEGGGEGGGGGFSVSVRVCGSFRECSCDVSVSILSSSL